MISRGQPQAANQSNAPLSASPVTFGIGGQLSAALRE